MRHAALEKGILPTIARSEQSHRAAIRAEPVEMLILSVKSGRQKPINRKSQNVFDFIEINGLSCAQVIEIIEYLNRDYSHELYGYPHTYGRLNVLVNNAGIVIRKSIEETTEDDLDRILAVNLKGAALPRCGCFR